MILTFLLIVIVNGLNQEEQDSKYFDEYKSVQDNEYTSTPLDTKTISLNGIGLQKTINYPNQIVNLNLNGQDNVIEVTKLTTIEEINLNGIRNKINLCLTHSPTINDNGLYNEINYLEC